MAKSKQTPKEFILTYCPNARVEKRMQSIKNSQDHRSIIRDAWPPVNLVWVILKFKLGNQLRFMFNMN